jgi:hypothetical protein
MDNNIEFNIATLANIPGILALQEKYLVTNLSVEQKKNGFVTTLFTVDQLTDSSTKQVYLLLKITTQL